MKYSPLLLALLLTASVQAATLTGTTPKNTYKDLLQVSNSNSGVDGTVRTVSDGEGTDTPLQLSSGAVNIQSGFQLGGSAVTAAGTTLATAANAAAQRTALGLTIGTNVQAQSALLQDIVDNLTATSGTVEKTGAGTFGTYTVTAAGKALIDGASASAQRTTLGLGTAALSSTGDFQAADSELAVLAGLTSAANKLPYFTGSGTGALADFTAAGRAILDDADASAQRTTLGLGSAAIESTSAFDAAGTASSAITTHEAAGDPHAQYLTAAEGNAAYQPLDADLTALGGVTSAANKLPYFTGSGTATVTDLSSAGRALIDDADASAQRTTLSLVPGTDVQAQNARLQDIATNLSGTSGTVEKTGASTFGTYTVTAAGKALIDDTDASAQRTTLGLGTAAQSNTGDFQAADGELAAVAGLTSAANKLPYFTGSGTATLADFTSAGRAILDDADASAQRTTLGLGTAALSATSDFQASDSELTALAGLTSAANKTPYFTGSGTAALADFTAAGRALMDDADASAQRDTLAIAPKIIVCTGADQTADFTAALSVSNFNLLLTGTCKTDAITLSNISGTIDMAPGAVLEPIAGVSSRTFWYFTSSDIVLKRFRGNGLNLVQYFLKLGTGTFNSPNSDIEIINVGLPSTTADDMTVGIYMSGTTNINVGRAAFSGFAVKGDGLCNSSNAIGSIRGMYLASTGWAHIKEYYFGGGAAAGDNGEQIDAFQAQLSTAGGIIDSFTVEYNEQTRRALKIQSGNWTIGNIHIVKGADFDAFSGSTDIGANVLNLVEFATTGPGSLDIVSGYIDASGAYVGVADSGSASGVHLHKDVRLVGGIKTATRDATVCNSDLVAAQPMGFFSATGSVNAGVDGAEIYYFGRGAVLQGAYSYVKGATFIDPQYEAAEVGFGTAKDGLQFSRNTVKTITSGALAASSGVVRVQYVTNLVAFDNILIENGNTTHDADFIEATNASATGSAGRNVAPSGTTGFKVGSSGVVNCDLAGVQAVACGGLNLSSATQGDILYASAANTYSKLAKDTNSTRYLSNTGTSNNPAWAQIGLTTGVTGTLPFGNGGFGISTATSGGIPYFSATNTVASSAALTANAAVVGGGAGAAPVASPMTVDPSTGAVAGYVSTVVTETTTARTLAGGDAGKTIRTTNGSAVTITVPNTLPVGFVVEVIQDGDGQVSFSGGATIQNRQTQTKTYGKYAAVRLEVMTNSGGSSAVVNLAGDTGS